MLFLIWESFFFGNVVFGGFVGVNFEGFVNEEFGSFEVIFFSRDGIKFFCIGF